MGYNKGGEKIPRGKSEENFEKEYEEKKREEIDESLERKHRQRKRKRNNRKPLKKKSYVLKTRKKAAPFRFSLTRVQNP